MAFPFGNHPTIAHYLTWAKNKANCKIESGTMGGDEFVILTAPNGKHVVLYVVDQKEFLLPTQIAHLDRRLGLKSRFDNWEG